jgi:hypothetical protein
VILNPFIDNVELNSVLQMPKIESQPKSDDNVDKAMGECGVVQ